MDYKIAVPSQLRDYLRALRKAAHLSQQSLGARVGLSQRSVAKIEADPAKVNFATIHALLAALDADLVIQVAKPCAQDKPW